MNNVNKYLKIAKDALVRPHDDIEQKIMDRISHINKKDEVLLDDSFLDFFRKSNSRLYLLAEKFKDSQAFFISLAVLMFFIIFFIFLFKKISTADEKAGGDPGLPSSKKEA
jgi:uncharacterized membrane protein